VARQIVQSQATKLLVILTLSSTGAPAEGVVYDEVTAQLRKEGGDLTAKTVEEEGWTEIGGGIYELAFSAAETNTLGKLLYLVSATGTTQFVDAAEVVAATQVGTAVDVITCMLTDHVFDVMGRPVRGASVVARLLGPTVQAGVGLADHEVSVATDERGQFFLPLARLAEVEVTISAARYKRRLTVPNQASAALFSVP
jgi:hypothetical protein